MRRIIFDVAAEQSLGAQLDYLIDRQAIQAARDLEARVRLFLVRQLSPFPTIGRNLGHRSLWEIWVPRTKLVLWYRFSDHELQIVAVWHGAQDRQMLR